MSHTITKKVKLHVVRTKHLLTFDSKTTQKQFSEFLSKIPPEATVDEVLILDYGNFSIEFHHETQEVVTAE